MLAWRATRDCTPCLETTSALHAVITVCMVGRSSAAGGRLKLACNMLPHASVPDPPTGAKVDRTVSTSSDSALQASVGHGVIVYKRGHLGGPFQFARQTKLQRFSLADTRRSQVGPPQAQPVQHLGYQDIRHRGAGGQSNGSGATKPVLVQIRR